MQFSSKFIEEAVHALASLPGIGNKTALRLVLHIMKKDPAEVKLFTEHIYNARVKTQLCRICYNFSDESMCHICKDPHRNKSVVCVVESIRDVMAIEETNQYNGVYHILGGVISPIDGVGPDDIRIDSLIDRVSQGAIQELIMAISPTIEGDTTIYYISKKLKPYSVNISTIARGVAFGGELEYADEVTLGRSIIARTPYTMRED